MKAIILFPFLFLALCSVSLIQAKETSIFKQNDGSEPALVLEMKNEANRQGEQKEPNNQKTSNTDKRTEAILQGKPGSSQGPKKPTNLTQPGRVGVHNQLESTQGKPGQTNERENSEPSSQQGKGKTRSFYNKNEINIKTTSNPLKSSTIDTQNSKPKEKNPTGNTKCLSIYKPVCGSDRKTYGNRCLLNEAKRLSNGKLNLQHEGEC